jgi:hypothetical protein
MSRSNEFMETTERYERWRAARIPVLAEDLATKHEQLASSPFALLRGTYYSFLQQFGELLPELARVAFCRGRAGSQLSAPM